MLDKFTEYIEQLEKRVTELEKEVQSLREENKIDEQELINKINYHLREVK